MVLPSITWADLTDEELRNLIALASEELNRRHLPDQINALSGELLALRGVQPGNPWTAPTHAENAYPKGWKVSHKGKQWESLVPFNTWEPGVDPNARLWKDLTAEAETPSANPQWAPNITATMGSVYEWQGTQYRVLQTHTTQAGWEPPVVPALWAKVIAPRTQKIPSPQVPIT